MSAAKRRRLLLVMLIFPPVAALALLLSNAPLVRSDWVGTDAALTLLFGPLVLPKPEPPLTTIVPLDDATMTNAWGVETASLPRAKLAALVDAILERKPRYLLIDVNLDVDARDPEGDAALRRVLGDPRRVRDTDILLIKAPRPGFPRAATGQCLDHAWMPRHAPGEHVRSTCFDDLVANGPTRAHLFWVNHAVGGWASDHVIRTVPRGRAACDRRGERVALFSPAYLIRILDRAGGQHLDRHAVVDGLADRLIAPTPACPARAAASGNAVGAVMKLMKDDPWLRPGENGKASYIAFKYPEGDDPSAASTKEIDKLVAGRLVIVGRTDAESRDWFETPAGRLTGVAVLAETIYTATTLPRPLHRSAVLTALTLLIALVLLIGETVIEPQPHHLVAIFLIYVVISSVAWMIALRGGWLMDLGVALFSMVATRFVIDTLHIGAGVARRVFPRWTREDPAHA